MRVERIRRSEDRNKEVPISVIGEMSRSQQRE
jgi:hypothetical protein